MLARTPPLHLSRKPGKRQWLNWTALFRDSKSRSRGLPKTQNATKPRPGNERLEPISKIMSHEYREATELDKAQEIGGVMLMARQNATEVLQPGKQSLDLPSPFVSTQCPAVLRHGPGPIAPMRGDQLDALLFQLGIELVTVVGLISDQSSRVWATNLPWTVSGTTVTSCGEADAMCTATGRPWRSATAMIFVPLPRLVFPTQSPLFSPPRRCRR